MNKKFSHYVEEYNKAITNRSERMKALKDQLSETSNKISELEKERDSDINLERFKEINNELKDLSDQEDFLNKQIDRLNHLPVFDEEKAKEIKGEAFKYLGDKYKLLMDDYVSYCKTIVPKIERTLEEMNDTDRFVRQFLPDNLVGSELYPDTVQFGVMLMSFKRDIDRITKFREANLW